MNVQCATPDEYEQMKKEIAVKMMELPIEEVAREITLALSEVVTRVPDAADWENDAIDARVMEVTEVMHRRLCSKPKGGA